MMEADAWENIASVIKCGKTQVPIDGRRKRDWHRNAQFRIDDQKLAAAARDLNQTTRGGITTTHLHIPLLSSVIQRKTPKSASTTRKEQLASGYPASGKWLRESDTETVCPNNSCANLFVICVLTAQSREIDIGSDASYIQVEFGSLVEAFLCVEG